MVNNLEKIQAILTLQLGVSKEEVTPDSKLGDDLGADSLDRVEIMMEVEEEFEIDTDERFWENENITVQNILDLIDLK
ncbi:MAG: phosphopantetheine-binding protein [Sarcina sp.]